ncbi:hypothetical protein LMG3412_03412 [Achromobacter deleyi]|nr:hypothetical protein LMG3412_03412 [Achromobacter deleyi]
MRPRESEGKAEGLDEDDNGEVRSEGSGPQSWALDTESRRQTGGLRSHNAKRFNTLYRQYGSTMECHC